MTVIPLQLGGVPFGGLSGRPSRWLSGSGRRADEGRANSPAAMITRLRAVTSDEREPERAVAEWTDEKLLGAYVEGDRAAFHVLTSRYRDELLHFLTRFLGTRASAEDVFQETFLQIHLSAETFDTSRRFKPWLFTIAANKARDHHRKYGRRMVVSLSSSIGRDEDGQRYVDLMETDLPRPESPVLDAERSRLVKSVVDSLAPHLREILLLGYFQRMSYTQIADALEIPLGTVKSRLHSAVGSFARSWTASVGEARRTGEGTNDHRDGSAREERKDGRSA